LAQSCEQKVFALLPELKVIASLVEMNDPQLAQRIISALDSGLPPTWSRNLLTSRIVPLRLKLSLAMAFIT
jgi:predicted DNA-binding transcriptional regulator YafY